MRYNVCFQVVDQISRTTSAVQSADEDSQHLFKLLSGKDEGLLCHRANGTVKQDLSLWYNDVGSGPQLESGSRRLEVKSQCQLQRGDTTLRPNVTSITYPQCGSVVGLTEAALRRLD